MQQPPRTTMGLNTVTRFISQFFAQKNKEQHNHLPPHLAERSLRTIALKKQQETDALRLNLEKNGSPRYKQVEQAGNFYRKSFYSEQLQPAPIVKETLSQIESILERIDPVDQNQVDTLVRLPRVKPETIRQAEVTEAQQTQQTPKDVPVVMEVTFTKDEPVETMFLEAIRKCRFLHHSIPCCLCVSPIQALNHPTATYIYGEVSPTKIIPIVPTRGLDEHIVRCFASPPRKIGS